MNSLIKNKKFESIDGLSEISISIIDDIAWFNIDKFDALSVKTFFYLLKDVIEYFKENNISFVKQYIDKNELNLFKNSSFIEIDDNIVIISTSLIDFPKEIALALGVELL
jgi:hypothetical protein